MFVGYIVICLDLGCSIYKKDFETEVECLREVPVVIEVIQEVQPNFVSAKYECVAKDVSL